MKLKLPEALLERLEALAAQHYATAAEFIRWVVTDYCVAVDRTPSAASPASSPATPPASSSPTPVTPPALGPGKSLSGYKGVYQNGRRWFACVVSDKQRKVLGTFDNPEDAAHAYDNELIRRAGGDLSAAVNFPGPNSALAEAARPFIEKLATEPITDEDWKAWRAVQSTFEPPRDALEIPVAPTAALKPEPESKPEPRAADEAEPDEHEPEAPTAEPMEADPDEVFSDEVLPVLPVQAVPNDGTPRPLVAFSPRPRKPET